MELVFGLLIDVVLNTVLLIVIVLFHLDDNDNVFVFW